MVLLSMIASVPVFMARDALPDANPNSAYSMEETFRSHKQQSPTAYYLFHQSLKYSGLNQNALLAIELVLLGND